MQDIGGRATDAGGTVTFTGRDPIVRSHFRIGACMAIPAMAAATSAAAIWRDRTGQAQDLEVDLRESVYNVLPYVGFVLQKKQALGLIDPDDPLPAGFGWRPTVNDRELQLPLLFGNPLSFAFFETKDGRMVTPTGLYPRHFVGFLNILGALRIVRRSPRRFDHGTRRISMRSSQRRAWSWASIAPPTNGWPIRKESISQACR